MTDYTPQIVDKEDVRSFFTPPISYDDISEAELLLRIKVIENFVSARYFHGSYSSEENVKAAVLLLIASDLASDPRISSKYHSLKSESFSGDYEYEISGEMTKSNAERWAEMAEDILNKYVASDTGMSKWFIRKVNG